MRTLVIILPAKGFDQNARLRHGGKGRHIQALVAQGAIEAFTKPVLPGTSRIDIQGFCVVQGEPGLDLVRHKLRSVIAAQVSWSSVPGSAALAFPRLAHSVRRRAPRIERRVDTQTACILAGGRLEALPFLACSYPEGCALELFLSTIPGIATCCRLKCKLSAPNKTVYQRGFGVHKHDECAARVIGPQRTSPSSCHPASSR